MALTMDVLSRFADAALEFHLWRARQIEWERYKRSREYMRSYRRQWKLEGPR